MRQQPSPIFSFLSFFFSLLLVTRIENCSLELPSGKYVIVGSGSSPFAPDKFLSWNLCDKFETDDNCKGNGVCIKSKNNKYGGGSIPVFNDENDFEVSFTLEKGSPGCLGKKRSTKIRLLCTKESEQKSIASKKEDCFYELVLKSSSYCRKEMKGKEEGRESESERAIDRIRKRREEKGEMGSEMEKKKEERKGEKDKSLKFEDIGEVKSLKIFGDDFCKLQIPPHFSILLSKGQMALSEMTLIEWNLCDGLMEEGECEGAAICITKMDQIEPQKKKRTIFPHPPTKVAQSQEDILIFFGNSEDCQCSIALKCAQRVDYSFRELGTFCRNETILELSSPDYCLKESDEN